MHYICRNFSRRFSWGRIRRNAQIPQNAAYSYACPTSHCWEMTQPLVFKDEKYGRCNFKFYFWRIKILSFSTFSFWFWRSRNWRMCNFNFFCGFSKPANQNWALSAVRINNAKYTNTIIAMPQNPSFPSQMCANIYLNYL